MHHQKSISGICQNESFPFQICATLLSLRFFSDPSLIPPVIPLYMQL